MKINLQITAILAGIMSFSIIGFHIFHKSKSKFRTTLGLGLIIIGFFGYLFGLLAQFAINKQREFLADSMAVQYTRNNHGIANALKKIKSMESGSLIFDPRYNQINHMLFASSSNLFNTHPPINDRIRAIDPDWDGKFIEVKNDLI
jgi:Zn-dependent protease with chaperone function